MQIRKTAMLLTLILLLQISLKKYKMEQSQRIALFPLYVMNTMQNQKKLAVT